MPLTPPPAPPAPSVPGGPCGPVAPSAPGGPGAPVPPGGPGTPRLMVSKRMKLLPDPLRRGDRQLVDQRYVGVLDALCRAIHDNRPAVCEGDAEMRALRYGEQIALGVRLFEALDLLLLPLAAHPDIGVPAGLE